MLILACEIAGGHVVELLLGDPWFDLHPVRHEALLTAIIANNVSVVKVLLDDVRTCPAAFSNQSLKVAEEIENLEIVELLLAKESVQWSLKRSQ